METLILTAHVAIAVIIVVLILLQHGKGADAGATFGAGNAGTVFGASGSGNFLSRTTAILTAIFFASSIGLAVIAKNKSKALYTLEDSTTSSTKSSSGNADTTNTPAALPAPEKAPATANAPAKPAEDTK